MRPLQPVLDILSPRLSTTILCPFSAHVDNGGPHIFFLTRSHSPQLQRRRVAGPGPRTSLQSLRNQIRRCADSSLACVTVAAERIGRSLGVDSWPHTCANVPPLRRRRIEEQLQLLRNNQGVRMCMCSGLPLCAKRCSQPASFSVVAS